MDVHEKLKELRAYAQKHHIPVLKEESAKVLEELVKKIKPKKVLEIGTSIGVSGIVVLSHSQAYLTTIEKDEKAFVQAAKNFKDLVFSKRVEMILGDCFSELMLMSKEFDLIILDGPKGHNLELTQLVLPMLKEGGHIFVDNIFYHDKVLQKGHVEHKHRTIVTNLRKFIEFIQRHTKLETRILRTGDGIAIIKKL